MRRDDLEIRVPLDYQTIKLLDEQARQRSSSRARRAKMLLRAGWTVQRLLSNPELVAALAEVPPDGDPEIDKRVRRLLQTELTGI
jgi:hypothetical protein